MSGEDSTLPVKLEKLEIVSGKGSIGIGGGENPFQRRQSAGASPALWGRLGHCSYIKRSLRSKGTFKRTSGKVLKEPVLKFINSQGQLGIKPDEMNTCVLAVPASHSQIPSKLNSQFTQSQNVDFSRTTAVQHDFRTLISSCSQMRISNGTESFGSESFQNAQQRVLDPGRSASQPTSSSNNNGGSRSIGTPSCSQQALNPPCDVTIDELASYFETLVHIPKKMSTMAEMMYI